MAAGTPYSKRYAGGFIDKPTLTTSVDSTFLNAAEAALVQLYGSAPTADGQVPVWVDANTKFGFAKLLNANIDSAAAISYSKLNLAASVVDADIAGSAAISRSKLNFGAGLVDADISASAAIAQSKLAQGPSHELVYTEFNGVVSITATTAGTANTVVTGNAATFDGNPILVTFYCPLIEPGATANSAIQVVVYVDGAQVGGVMWYAAKDNSAVIDAGETGCMFSFRTTPSAGTHTYSIRAFRAVSNGSVVAGSSYANGYIRVTKV